MSSSAEFQGYKASKGVVFFCTKDKDPLPDASWVKLDHVHGPKDMNAGPFRFERTVTITQKGKGANCTLTLKPQQYTNPVVRLSEDRPKGKVFKIDIACRCYEGDDKYSLQLEGNGAQDLPVAKLCSTFAWISLEIHPTHLSDIGPQLSGETDFVMSKLRTLLAGIATLDVENMWNKILADDLACLSAETEAQKAQLGIFDNCRIKTKRGGVANLNLVIEVYRGIAREPIDNVEATSQPVPPPLPSSPLAPPTPFSNLEQAQSPQDKDPIDALDTLVKSFEKVWLTHRNAAEEARRTTGVAMAVESEARRATEAAMAAEAELRRTTEAVMAAEAEARRMETLALETYHQARKELDQARREQVERLKLELREKPSL